MRSTAPARAVRLAAALALATPILGAAPTEEVAVIRTDHGEMTVRFFESEAPQHVAYVKELIRRGFYDGTSFHRVIPSFVIQGGDPNSKDADRSNDGEGEADRRLPAEFSATLHYRPGTVGMARDVDPDSGSCQFFIALENLPRLDGKYTIFGELISGIEVARKIADLPRDLRDNPLTRVSMQVAIRRQKVSASVTSREAGESGEVLTGPGKPKPWDPGDVRWVPPVLLREEGGSLGTETIPETGIDVSTSESGSVLDVRIARTDDAEAPRLVEAVRRWRFVPARLEGRPVKTRFSMSSRGGDPFPSQAPGTPVEAGGEVTAPGAAVPVPVPAGVPRPGKEPILRLTVDEQGRVADVSIQASSGDAGMDRAATEAARRLVFVPATRNGEPVAVYLNLPGRFVEPAP
jgi:TonB family protein